MPFEWDPQKSIANKEKHGIDFETATRLWADENRVEIHASYPVEDRWILIGKKDDKLWTAVYTLRDRGRAPIKSELIGALSLIGQYAFCACNML